MKDKLYYVANKINTVNSFDSKINVSGLIYMQDSYIYIIFIYLIYFLLAQINNYSQCIIFDNNNDYLFKDKEVLMLLLAALFPNKKFYFAFNINLGEGLKFPNVVMLNENRMAMFGGTLGINLSLQNKAEVPTIRSYAQMYVTTMINLYVVTKNDFVVIDQMPIDEIKIRSGYIVPVFYYEKETSAFFTIFETNSPIKAYNLKDLIIQNYNFLLDVNYGNKYYSNYNELLEKKIESLSDLYVTNQVGKEKFNEVPDHFTTLFDETIPPLDPNNKNFYTTKESTLSLLLTLRKNVNQLRIGAARDKFIEIIRFDYVVNNDGGKAFFDTVVSLVDVVRQEVQLALAAKTEIEKRLNEGGQKKEVLLNRKDLEKPLEIKPPPQVEPVEEPARVEPVREAERPILAANDKIEIVQPNIAVQRNAVNFSLNIANINMFDPNIIPNEIKAAKPNKIEFNNLLEVVKDVMSYSVY